MHGHRKSRPDVAQYVEVACPTGKRSFLNRRTAKKWMRQHEMHECRPYRCDECELWHVGHLPKPVIAGEMERAEVDHRHRLKLTPPRRNP